MALTSDEMAHAELVGSGATILHKHKLNACDVPDGAVDFAEQQALQFVIENGAVDFAEQQALQFVIENRTSDPISPVDGHIWLRTDL
jgi:hypothetical protein